jgi:uncharacterized protein
MKFLLWGVVVFIVVMWLLRTKKIPAQSDGNRHDNTDNTQRGAEAMVRCVHCGTHIPVSEAIAGPSNAAFCSEEHRLQHVSG